MRLLTRVEFIVVHTVGSRGDTTMAAIRRYHMTPESQGGPPGGPWEAEGYHRGIRKGGELEEGRSVRFQGAHVAGLNDRSLGVCVYGHGDVEEHTPAQRIMLLRTCHDWMKEYMVPVENVIGHHEAYDLPGVPNTGKTCPGLLVDMDEIRAQLSVPHVIPEPDPEPIGVPTPEPEPRPEPAPDPPEDLADRPGCTGLIRRKP